MAEIKPRWNNPCMFYGFYMWYVLWFFCLTLQVGWFILQLSNYIWLIQLLFCWKKIYAIFTKNKTQIKNKYRFVKDRLTLFKSFLYFIFSWLGYSIWQFVRFVFALGTTEHILRWCLLLYSFLAFYQLLRSTIW